jgi:hypothetical protein
MSHRVVRHHAAKFKINLKCRTALYGAAVLPDFPWYNLPKWGKLNHLNRKVFQMGIEYTN